MDSAGNPSIIDIPFDAQMRAFRMFELSTVDEGHVEPTFCFKVRGLVAVEEEGPNAVGPRLSTIATAEPARTMDFYSFVQLMHELKKVMPAKANGLRLVPYLRLLDALVSDEEDSRIEKLPVEKLVDSDLKEMVSFGPFYASYKHAMSALNGLDLKESHSDHPRPTADWVARTVRISRARSELPGLLTAFISGKQDVRTLRVDVYQAEQEAMYTSQESTEPPQKSLADIKAELARAEKALFQLHSKSFMRLFRCLVTVTDAWAMSCLYSLTSTDPADPGCLAMKLLPFMASDGDELSDILARGMCDDTSFLNERENELEESVNQKLTEQEKEERAIAAPTEQRPVRPFANAVEHIRAEGYNLDQEPVDPNSIDDFPPLASNNPFLIPIDNETAASARDDSSTDHDGSDSEDGDVFDYRKRFSIDSMSRGLLEEDAESATCQSPVDQPTYRGSRNPFRPKSFGTEDAEDDRACIGAQLSEYSSSPYGQDVGRFVVVSDGEPLTQSVLKAAEGSVSEVDNTEADANSVTSSTSSVTPTPTVVAQPSEKPGTVEPTESEANIFEDAVEVLPTHEEPTTDLSRESKEEAMVVAKAVEKQEQSQAQTLEIVPESTDSTPESSSQDGNNKQEIVVQNDHDEDLDDFDVVNDFEPKANDGKARC